MISRREFHRRIVKFAGVGSAALWLPGCTQKTEIDEKSGGKKTLTIGMIAKSETNPVFQAGRKGAEARAKELGVKLDWRTPTNEDGAEQAKLLEQLVADGADAVTIACSDADKVTLVIDSAVKKGAAVMCFDSDAPKSKRLCYVGTDDVEAGRSVVRELAGLLKGQPGTVAILAGNRTATNLQRRVAGAKEEVGKHAGLKLYGGEGADGVVYHKETPHDALAEVERVQKANPDINCWAMIGGWPLMSEVKMPWDASKVFCVAVDTLKPQLKHLRMGDVQVLLGQRYFYFGGRCIDILVDYVKSGKKPEKEIEFAPLDRVTKDNVDEYEKNWEKWS